MTQHSPCYSAFSSSLMNPLPYCSNYPHLLPRSPDQYFTKSLRARPFTKPLRWRLTATQEKHSALRKLNNKQRQKMLLLLLLFKLSSQFPFVSFLSISILSLLPFSILSLLPFLISPSLSTIPSFSSDQFFVLLR